MRLPVDLTKLVDPVQMLKRNPVLAAQVLASFLTPYLPLWAKPVLGAAVGLFTQHFTYSAERVEDEILDHNVYERLADADPNDPFRFER